MDLQLRKEFHESLEKLSEKYNLDDLVFASFVIQYGYRNKYSASDIVYAVLAILESSVIFRENYNEIIESFFSREKNRKNVLILLLIA